MFLFLNSKTLMKNYFDDNLYMSRYMNILYDFKTKLSELIFLADALLKQSARGDKVFQSKHRLRQ